MLKSKSAPLVLIAVAAVACAKPQKKDRDSDQPSNEGTPDSDYNTVEWVDSSASEFTQVLYSDIFAEIPSFKAEFDAATSYVEYDKDDAVTQRVTRTFDSGRHLLSEKTEEPVTQADGTKTLVLTRSVSTEWQGHNLKSRLTQSHSAGVATTISELTREYKSDDEWTELSKDNTYPNGLKVERACQDLVCTTTSTYDGKSIDTTVETYDENGVRLKNEMVNGDGSPVYSEVYDPSASRAVDTEWNEQNPSGFVHRERDLFKGTPSVFTKEVYRGDGDIEWTTTCDLGGRKAECKNDKRSDSGSHFEEQDSIDLVQYLYHFDGTVNDYRFMALRTSVEKQFSDDGSVASTTTITVDRDDRFRIKGRTFVCETNSSGLCIGGSFVETRTLNDRGLPTALKQVDDKGKQIYRAEAEY